tara:strand:- start:619 stop:1056 length:438 start_codon:yes stop_codon:yes gene_type:complete
MNDKAEIEIIKELKINNVFGDVNINKCGYEYSRYDAFIRKNCIIEIKDRITKEGCKIYDSLEIEFDKYSYNIEFSRYGNINFYFVCRYEGNIFVFDMTNLSECNYNFNWKWEMRPKSTKFNDNRKIPKYVSKIPIKLAWVTLPLV